MLWDTVDTETEVRFSDTDMQGVVWHGNYLCYLELGRFAWFDKMKDLFLDVFPSNCNFIVIAINIQYIEPAKFGDRLLVKTVIQDMSRAQFIFNQNIYNNKNLLIKSEVRMSALDKENKIVIISRKIINNFRQGKQN